MSDVPRTRTGRAMIADWPHTLDRASIEAAVDRIEREATVAALYDLRAMLFPLPIGLSVDFSRGREDERLDTIRLIDAAIAEAERGTSPTPADWIRGLEGRGT